MIADVKKTAEQKMQKTVEALKADLGKVRTGPRAHRAPRSHHGGLLRHADADQPGRERDAARRAHDRRQPWEKKMAGASRRRSAIPTSG